MSGGVADRNGQLKVGDKLIAINHQDVIGKPLSDVVNMLMMIERGTVIISVAHKLSTAEEERPFFGSLGGSGEFPSIREENSPEVLPSVDMLMNDCVDEIITKSLLVGIVIVFCICTHSHARMHTHTHTHTHTRAHTHTHYIYIYTKLYLCLCV